ncbi:MAG: outer membrane protein assembly factor BamA [Verrucomicrobiales bacterium]|nr:outer membrane protein assembly factor BamA [Verrucomicrobiales bacterium]
MFLRSWLGRCCILFCLPLCLAAALIPLPAGAQGQPTVKEIAVMHVGPRSVSDDLVRANIRVKAGDPYSKLNIDEDVRNLYATGYFFNIRVTETREVDGVRLAYFVQARPVLSDIRYQGNDRFSTKKVAKKVVSKVGQPLDEAQLFKDAQEIKKSYEKSGYLKTEVKYVLNIDESAGRGTVTFDIQETPKQRIKRVEFPGHAAFKEKKLRKVVKTRRRWMFSWITGSGRLKEDVIEEDRDRIASFYRNEGYIDFELKDIKVEELDPEKLKVNFVIEEGQKYQVGSIRFEGNKLFTTNEIVGNMRRREGTKVHEGLNLNPGDTFKPNLHSKDIDLIEDFYGARGYIDVSFPQTLKADRIPNTASNTIDLAYRVEEGSQSYIEKVEIKGNNKTRDRVIRRELAVSPGEIFNMVRVRISTNRLYGLQYFEKVDARDEQTEVPNRRNLVIGVEEKNTGNFNIGAGFSSVDNLVGFVEMTQGNFDLFNPPFFTGGGQKLRLRAQVGTQRQDYLITFIEPWFLGQRLSLSVDLYHRDLQFLSDLYDEQRTGAEIGLTKSLAEFFRYGEFFRAGVSYTIESVNLDFDDEDLLAPVSRDEGPGHGSSIITGTPRISPELAQEEGRRLVSKVGASLVYDTRNAVILPNKGQRIEISGELAGGVFGGDTDYYKIQLRGAQYLPGFFEGHIVEIVGRIGVSEAYGDSPRVPLFDRFTLGGLYTLRGFKYREVGPVDENDEPVGGSTHWFGSLEYSMPVVERVRFAVFYDVGMVYYDPYSFELRETQKHFYNDNWGVGVRLNLPIGPLRLDYAFPITAEDYNDTSGGRFQFGVGYSREF